MIEHLTLYVFMFHSDEESRGRGEQKARGGDFLVRCALLGNSSQYFNLFNVVPHHQQTLKVKTRAARHLRVLRLHLRSRVEEATASAAA